MTGEEFKALRIKKGFTRGNLSIATGVSISAIQSWEIGKREVNPIAIAFLKKCKNKPIE